MRIGGLDRRIQLQHRTLSRDAMGQQTESFATYATVWAQKRDVSGREFFTAQQVNAENSTTFTIRHRADVVITDQIVFEGVSYNIRQIAEVGRRDFLEIIGTTV